MRLLKRLFTFEGLKDLLSQLQKTGARFPIPCVITLLLTLYGLDQIFELGVLQGSFSLTVLLITGLIGTTAISILAESYSLRHSYGIILSIILITTLCLYFYWLYPSDLNPSHWLILLASIFGLITAGFWQKATDQASFWFFNYTTANSVFFGVVSAVILGVGLSVIFTTLSYLFGFELDEKFYQLSWLFSGAAVLPIYVLSNLETNFYFEESECEFPKGIRFIVKYLLAPLMITFLLILYAYVGKLIFNWSLPKGNLGWMTSLFGVIGIWTLIIAYPMKESASGILQRFFKYFIPALIVPTLMLFISALVRIFDYGLTHGRYYLLALGIWFCLIIFNQFRNNGFINIKFAIQSKFLILVVSLLPFLGASHLSAWSQISRLDHLLIDAGYYHLDDKTVSSLDHATQIAQSLSFDQKKEISSIVDYLQDSKIGYNALLDRLRLSLSDNSEGEQSTLCLTSYEYCHDKSRLSVYQLSNALGFSFIYRYASNEANQTRYFYYPNQYLADPKTASTFDVSDYQDLAVINLDGLDNEEKTILTSSGQPIEIKGQRLTIKNASTTFDFDLSELTEPVAKAYLKEKPLPKAPAITTVKHNNGDQVKIIITKARGTLSDEGVEVQELSFLILLSLKSVPVDSSTNN